MPKPDAEQSSSLHETINVIADQVQLLAMDVATDPNMQRRLQIAEQLGALAGVALRLREIAEETTEAKPVEQVVSEATVLGPTTTSEPVAEATLEKVAPEPPFSVVKPLAENQTEGTQTNEPDGIEEAESTGATSAEAEQLDKSPVTVATAENGAAAKAVLSGAESVSPGAAPKTGQLAVLLASKIKASLQADPTRGFSPAELRRLDTTPGSQQTKQQRFSVAIRLLQAQGVPIAATGKTAGRRYQWDGAAPSEPQEALRREPADIVVQVAVAATADTVQIEAATIASQPTVELPAESRTAATFEKPVVGNETQSTDAAQPQWRLVYDMASRKGSIDGIDITTDPAVMRVINAVQKRSEEGISFRELLVAAGNGGGAMSIERLRRILYVIPSSLPQQYKAQWFDGHEQVGEKSKYDLQRVIAIRPPKPQPQDGGSADFLAPAIG